jgi:hypothetical protein
MNYKEISRRHFLRDCGLQIGTMALGSLLAGSSAAQGSRLPTQRPPDPLAPRKGHFTPKAKRVIFLFMAGGPSHLDLFDNKPLLREYQGKPLPDSIIGDQRYAFIQRNASVLGSPFIFGRHGNCGAELSELLPNLAGIVDDIAIVRSMHTDQFNHGPGQLFMNTGSPLPGRPSMGSWVTYGLGCETKDLPGFVVLNSAGGTSAGAANYASGFLPTIFAGVPFRSKGNPILNVANPPGIDARMQRESLDLIGDLNRQSLDLLGDPEIRTRIENYEMAFRMQTSAPELMDLTKESKATLDLYGAKPGEASFASSCLLARRLVERGVRFVNIYHEVWDHHSDVAGGLRSACGQTDKASAALVKDLKQRGLLEDTLVVWGGEFGRTPMVESSAALGRANGRDHHPQAYSMWLAGGGIKGGITWGATDEMGFHVVKDPVHTHDLQATLLHCLGLEHTRLTHRFQGRDYRLTDVFGNVVKGLLA